MQNEGKEKLKGQQYMQRDAYLKVFICHLYYTNQTT